MVPWRAASSSDPALSGTVFELERCERCGTARTLGPPPPVEAHETSYYAATRGLTDRLIKPLRALSEADRMRSVRSIEPGDRVLEVGSGDGRFLARIRRRGAVVVGIEPSPEARARSAEAGVEALPVGAEDANMDQGALAAMIAWHSLEHLDDPGETLRRAREWVRPGGRLVVAVPNLNSLQARIGGNRWFHQDVPRHRIHFTAKGAAAIVTRSGFEVERVRHFVVEQNPLGMWQTLLNRLTTQPDVAYRGIKRDPTLRRGHLSDLLVTAIAGIPLIPVAIALELLAAGARRGGTIVVEARLR